MFRLGLLLILVACIVLAVTNPGMDVHKQAVYRNLPSHAGAEGLFGEIAGTMLGTLDPLPIRYHNYYLFSTTTFRDDTLSVGLLTRAWATRTDGLPVGN